MAGRVISISRFVDARAALAVLILSNALFYRCQGQWWFSTSQATPPSPPASSSSSTGTYSSSSSSSPSSTVSPPPSPGFPFNVPAAPPSSGSSNYYSSAATPPPPEFPTNFQASESPSPSSSSLTTYSSPAPPYSGITAATPSPSSSATTTNSTLTVMSTAVTFGSETIYTSVQDAIDAVPENNTDVVTIVILAGTYTEKVSVPSTKPYITLQGAGRNTTIITYNDTANSTGSTVKSATVSVFAASFTARNITFQNSAPHAIGGEIGAQAVALLIAGDMAAFYGCGFVSSQDTICDETGRHFFRDCYIEGNIDTIWGNGQSLYKYCQINSTAGQSGGGSITAQGRSSDSQTTGFAFVGGSIAGSGESILGRAYGNYSRVIFVDTFMDDVINPVGWTDWPTTANSTASTRHEYYAEFNNTGPGANLTNRVSWMINLTDAEAANFTSVSFIDGSSWLTSET